MITRRLEAAAVPGARWAMAGRELMREGRWLV
jgi:hypothetical protein